PGRRAIERHVVGAVRGARRRAADRRPDRDAHPAVSRARLVAYATTDRKRVGVWCRGRARRWGARRRRRWRSLARRDGRLWRRLDGRGGTRGASTGPTSTALASVAAAE